MKPKYNQNTSAGYDQEAQPNIFEKIDGCQQKYTMTAHNLRWYEKLFAYLLLLLILALIDDRHGLEPCGKDRDFRRDIWVCRIFRVVINLILLAALTYIWLLIIDKIMQ